MNELENNDYLSKYLPFPYHGLVIQGKKPEDSYLHYYDAGCPPENKLASGEEFSKVTIKYETYEDTFNNIKDCLHYTYPKVLVIDNLQNPDVARAIYDSGDLFREHDYVLELANTQYCLVRRDCYFKQN